ncbi:MAG: hypothetical protein GEU90_05955 [Gemmatimonas sp.]|nr:hypothetical protein [Gemmatimonas sp.]
MRDDGFTFETFSVGTSNQLAVTAARRVSESPGTIYNPLVICGPTGTGKSHLLKAIASAIQRLEPDRSVHVDSAESIADRVTTGIVENGLGPLRDALGGFDVLLLDDLDELAGFGRTQSELGRIVRRLVDARRQVVLASALPPSSLDGFDRDLLELLNSGLVAELDQPDLQTRRGVVVHLLARSGTSWAHELIDALASYALDAGELESRIATLVDFQRERDRPLNSDDIDRHCRGVRRDHGGANEFGSFLEDVGRAVAAVVAAEPWRRRIGEAILRWEGEGVRTTRLDAALEADSSPDVETLLEDFTRDAARLLEIRGQLGSCGARLDDPDDLETAESLLTDVVAASAADDEDGDPRSLNPPSIDPFFLDADRVLLTVTDVEGRLVEEPG